MKRYLAAAFAILLVPGFLAAQDGSGAEALHAMVGQWEYEHVDGSVTCDMLGENWVHCRGSWVNDAGNEVHAVFSNGYNPNDDQYVSVRYYGNGYMDSGRMWIDGDTWTTLYVNGNGVVRKLTGVLSATSWAYHWEAFDAEGNWEETDRGSMTKR